MRLRFFFNYNRLSIHGDEMGYFIYDKWQLTPVCIVPRMGNYFFTRLGLWLSLNKKDSTRCEKYSSKLDISRSFVCIFAKITRIKTDGTGQLKRILPIRNAIWHIPGYLLGSNVHIAVQVPEQRHTFNDCIGHIDWLAVHSRPLCRILPQERV